VILDVDGTLVDSNDAHARAWVDAFAAEGITVAFDVAAAGRAGVPIIALECGGWRREELNGAIAVYADPAHLLSRYGSSPLAALASRTQTRA
jgi:beta-phosphoglucomutase-like phosphatase (HAD superfamily)